jgi:ribosomal protein S18 acetylase RimI-like enzyme
MNKLFIFQEDILPEYLAELESAYRLCKADEHAKKINLGDCNIDRLKSVDVVVSNSLPYEWQVILNGLKIVSVVIDKIEKNDNFTDIYIDHLYKGKDKYFVGENYSISNGRVQDINFQDIFNLISMLEWDTDYWGFPVAFLSSRHLSENILYKVNEFVKNENIRLVEYLCNCHDKKSVLLAEENGYDFKDIRLTYEKILKEKMDVDLDRKIEFREAEEQHIPALREISRDIYLDSRYYYDNNFDKDKVCEFYMGWVEKAVKKEYDDECFALFINKTPVAYCSVKYESSTEVQIGLVGVSNDYVGIGLGKELLAMVFNALLLKGYNRVLVVTQGRNYPAQRLYQKVGFLTLLTELWYHKWVY